MNILSIVLTIITAIFGTGFFWNFFTLRSMKRKSLAEAKTVELDYDVRERKFNDERIDKMRETIERQDEIIEDLQRQFIKVKKTQMTLKMELLEEQERYAVAKHWECKVECCNHRIPPRKEHPSILDEDVAIINEKKKIKNKVIE